MASSRKKSNKSKNNHLKDVDYEKAGRMFVDIVQSSYAKRWRLFTLSAVKGFFGGLGGVIGATVGVALLLYLLSFIDSIPIIDHFIDLVKTESPTNQISE